MITVENTLKKVERIAVIVDMQNDFIDGALGSKEAVAIVEHVKNKIAELDHWADKPETKAIVDNLIRDTLWAELPESYDEISITTYRKEIYEYIYLRYKTAA